MRTFLVSVVLVAPLVAVTAMVQAQSAADEAAIRQANEQRITVWNAKDVKAYLTFFDEDCTEGWVAGPCAADPRAGAFPETAKNARLTIPDETGVVFIAPDVAVLRYTYEGSGFLNADGKPEPPGKTQRAEVFVRKGGKWLLAARFSQPVEE